MQPWGDVCDSRALINVVGGAALSISVVGAPFSRLACPFVAWVGWYAAGFYMVRPALPCLDVVALDYLAGPFVFFECLAPLLVSLCEIRASIVGCATVVRPSGCLHCPVSICVLRCVVAFVFALEIVFSYHFWNLLACLRV